MKGAVAKGSIKKLSGVRRKAITSPDELVKQRPLLPQFDLPLVIEPAVSGVDLVGWAAEHKVSLESELLQRGALLFRGFDVNGPPVFDALVQALSGELLEYRERSTPRHQVHSNVYTSTDYPAAQSIFPHNENSYQQVFPLHLYFFCNIQPEVGGETPIVDCRKVFRRIDPQVVERFRQKDIMYVRNFREGLGLSWQSVFQTSDRQQVDAYCQAGGIQTEWISDDHLRIRRVLPAIARHPRSGEEVWFNHGTFFHVTTLEETVREAMVSQYGEEDLPNHTYYGDGTPIEPDTVAHLRECYLAEKVVFPWKRGDVLWLDNMFVAHAREPYQGQRQILAAMAVPCSRDACRGD